MSSHPVRVGLIGLSKSLDTMKPGAWGGIAHLPSILAMPSQYQLVALCNTSVASAEGSIAKHSLPASTKAYGSPADLAADPDVDLVVVSVGVEKHVELALPALKAGKDLLVEWPLASTTAEAQALLDAGKASGSKRMLVGLQSRASPWMLKLKELVHTDKVLGEVTSSTLSSTFWMLSGPMWPANAAYYISMKSGGNSFHIWFAHVFDSVTQILGGLDKLQSIVTPFNKTVQLLGDDGSVIDPAYPKDTPDHIFVQGELANGGVASISFRNAFPTVDETMLRWTITGTEGELELTMTPCHWQMATDHITLRVRGKADAEPRSIAIPASEFIVAETNTRVPGNGTNTSLMYQALAQGDTSKYASFEEAVELQATLDKILAANVA